MTPRKPRAVGINHVALEVGDLEEALAFWGSIVQFGRVVDDKQAVREVLLDRGIEIAPGRRLNFRDPWGNHIQVVDYRDIQFSKHPDVLSGMGLADLEKRPDAVEELREKGLA